MMLRFLPPVLSMFFVAVSHANVQTESAVMEEVTFEQKLGSQVPLDLQFPRRYRRRRVTA